MKIGYLQFKPELLNVKKNIEKIQTLLANTDFDLMVLPELANSGYLFTDLHQVESVAEEFKSSEYLQALSDIAREKNGYIVSGFCERDKKDFYNSAALVCPDGNKYLYRKIHLFMNEPKFFKSGNIPFSVINIQGKFGKVKIGMMICYDWIFPESARTLALRGAQIICHPSNLVMPYCQKVMYTRAIENRVFTITCNRIGTEVSGDSKLNFTGNSVVVAPNGKYLIEMSDLRATSEECKVFEINPEDALNKFINPINNVITDRREEFYI